MLQDGVSSIYKRHGLLVQVGHVYNTLFGTLLAVDRFSCQVVVKSIMTREAAEEALAHGVDAVWVSNHGGRQLDTVPATIEILPEVGVD